MSGTNEEKQRAIIAAHEKRVDTREKALSMAFVKGLESGAVGFVSGGLLSYAASKSQLAKYMSLSAKLVCTNNTFVCIH